MATGLLERGLVSFFLSYFVNVYFGLTIPQLLFGLHAAEKKRRNYLQENTLNYINQPKEMID